MSSEVILVDDEIGQELVRLARRGLEHFLHEGQYYVPDPEKLPPQLQEPGATFVTLTNRGRLRGCIGHTLARRPLAQDVARNAAAAARDFRFVPVQPNELTDIRLEVTVLTPFQRVIFLDYADLLGKLRVGIDGVMLSLDYKRALLLPQVWRRLPDAAQFLEAIANKAGIPSDALRTSPPTVDVQVFQAQHFAESGYREPGT